MPLLPPIKRCCRAVALAGLSIAAITLPAAAAMYKWVDEHGSVHYGDTVPPKYANRAMDRSAKPAPRYTGTEQSDTGPVVEPVDAEKRAAEAKRQLERNRQDNALLATYLNEAEIELARGRELKRNEDTLKMATAGLARSRSAEDRRKLDTTMDLMRQEIDSINARFDAYKVRYRELSASQPTKRRSQQDNASER